jgi:hypothetical protein
VGEVSEHEVFESANGGFAARAAFWVVYINHEQKQKATRYSIYDCSPYQSYNELLSASIK